MSSWQGETVADSTLVPLLDFRKQYLDFELEDVMWGLTYQRRKKRAPPQ